MKNCLIRCSALLALVLLLAPPALGQVPDFTAVVREAAGAVVNLSGSPRPVLPDLPLAEDEDVEGERGVLQDLMRRHYGRPQELGSLGSGFVIDAAGYIVTNAHLVESAEHGEIVVRL